MCLIKMHCTPAHQDVLLVPLPERDAINTKRDESHTPERSKKCTDTTADEPVHTSRVELR